MLSEFINYHHVIILKILLAVSLIEFIVLVLLINYIKIQRKRFSNAGQSDFDKIKEYKNKSINMFDLVDSITKSKALYKLLCSHCHPDRFVNEELKRKANFLIQEITENKTNYPLLMQLKHRAEEELNITIN